MGKIIGIDLGTTNSAVSVFDTVTGQAIIIENDKGARTTPSVIAFKPEKINKKTQAVTPAEWIVGVDAKNQAATNPHFTYYGVKRLIGRRMNDPSVAKMQQLASYDIVPGKNGDAWVQAPERAMAPAEISAKVLRKLKEAAEKHLGEEITEAVVTVPAYFNDAQKQATIDAGKIAGLDIKRIINEPTAAALAYGVNRKQSGKVAVYDLGGGTFDISILEVDMEAGGIEVKGVNGDTFLGGENFDEAVTAYLVDVLNKEYGTALDLHEDTSGLSAEEETARATTIQRLRDAAEKAKIALSSQDSVSVNIPFLTQNEDGGVVNFEHEMSRKQLEDLLGHFVEKTLVPVKQALQDAGLTVDQLDEVILVGGQTRMPLVIETVKKFFGKEPRRDVNPDEIVAMGAAVQGGIMTGDMDHVVLLDVIPLSIGIRAKNDIMSVVIPRNHTIPCEVTKTFRTSEDNQEDVAIKVYQGERELVTGNKFMGEFVLEDLPPGKAGTVEINIVMKIDENGVLTVTAKDQLGREKHVTVKANGGLSEADVEKMLKDAQENAEKDRAARQALAAGSEADHALKVAEKDMTKEYFTSAPSELQEQFKATVAELTTARKENNVAVMVEKLKVFNDLRLAIGEAFNKSSAPAEEGGADEQAAPTPSAPKGNDGPGM